MIRNALFASMIVLGAAGAAQASDPGPRLVNRNGTQEVVYGPQGPDNVIGGAFATIAGGGANLVYRAAPGGRTQEADGRIGRVVTVNGETRVVYAPAASTASATMLAGRCGRRRPGPVPPRVGLPKPRRRNPRRALRYAFQVIDLRERALVVRVPASTMGQPSDPRCQVRGCLTALVASEHPGGFARARTEPAHAPPAHRATARCAPPRRAAEFGGPAATRPFEGWIERQVRAPSLTPAFLCPTSDVCPFLKQIPASSIHASG
jgi:hypothetical protein